MSAGYDRKSSRAGSILTVVGLCWSQEEPDNVGGDSVGVVVVVVLEETEEEEVLVSTEGSRDAGMSKGRQNDSGSKPPGTSKSTSQVQSDDDESWYPSKGENASNLTGVGSGLVVIEGDTLAAS